MINDWLLASQARGQSIRMNNQIFKKHKSSRGFTKLHEILLKINSEYNLIADYLTSLKTEELMIMINLLNSFRRMPLVWAVKYRLTASIELLLTFGADSNQLCCTKDSSFSPLIHLAIAESHSAWMNADILKTIRLLILAGANLNRTDHEDWTPLHIAASWSLFSITDMLQQCDQDFLNWQAQTFTGKSIFDICNNIDYQNRYWGISESSMCLTWLASILYKRKEAKFPICILSSNALLYTLKCWGLQHIFILIQYNICLDWPICITVHFIDQFI